jgi:hypothetical protein
LQLPLKYTLEIYNWPSAHLKGPSEEISFLHGPLKELRNKREVLLAARVATFLITGIASLPSVEGKSIQPAQGNSLIIKTNDLHQQKTVCALWCGFLFSVFAQQHKICSIFHRLIVRIRHQPRAFHFLSRIPQEQGQIKIDCKRPIVI